MKRKQLLLPAIALVSLLAGFLLFKLVTSESQKQNVNVSAQEIDLQAIPLTSLDGTESLLGDWQDKILVVNFWAPWCAPCRREIPALIEIQNEYAERGVRVLGIAFDGEQQVRDFAVDYNIDYPLFISANRSAMYNAALKNPSGSLPYTALIGADLRIVYQHNGELSAAQLRERLEALL